MTNIEIAQEESQVSLECQKYLVQMLVTKVIYQQFDTISIGLNTKIAPKRKSQMPIILQST